MNHKDEGKEREGKETLLRESNSLLFGYHESGWVKRQYSMG